MAFLAQVLTIGNNLIIMLPISAWIPILCIGDSSVEIFQSYSSRLADAISDNLIRVINELSSASLIPLHKKREIITTTGLSDYNKSTNLVMFIESELDASLNPGQFLIDICHVLINQQHQRLKNIATSILQQLGKPVHVYNYGHVCF